MSNKLSVLIASSEIRPLAQTGGLADVAGSLPLALKRQGAEAAVIMPAYQNLLQNNSFQPFGETFYIRQGSETLEVSLLRGELSPTIPAYLVRCDRYFDRPGLYGYQGVEHPDNAERFALFCQALIKSLPSLASYPDIVLANDWQTGLVMPYLKLLDQPRPRGVFVIHNQGYLGLTPPEKWPLLALPDSFYQIDGLEYFGQASLLKAGICYSSALVTVSPTYAQEIQTPEGGHGLDGAMRHYSHKLHGIVNGIDCQLWNPATDPLIAATYSSADLSGKRECKKDLLRHFGLEQLGERPLAGIVSRLTAQKGFSLVADAAEDIFRLGLGLVILGAGEPYFEDMARDLARRFPDRCQVHIGYDEALAHRLVAGCDLMLLPSMYEPCGLVQMYALRYGSIPVVRAVGGLNDTVRDYAGANPSGLWDTGFKFSQFQANALVLALRRAVELYEQPELFDNMRRTALAEDFSWDSSARSYLQLFEKVLAS